ncbi:MAG TPA: hypothetical protein VF648_21345 [Pyrinomonadaceae bacterium]|jgi:hypothetical protein
MNTILIPSAAMTDSKEKGRSIRFPQELWDALDRDAERCKRSSQKQLEALLMTYYEIDNVEIDKKKLEQIRGESYAMKGVGEKNKIVGTSKEGNLIVEVPELDQDEPEPKNDSSEGNRVEDNKKGNRAEDNKKLGS